jgi:hypothetical protein
MGPLVSTNLDSVSPHTINNIKKEIIGRVNHQLVFDAVVAAEKTKGLRGTQTGS